MEVNTFLQCFVLLLSPDSCELIQLSSYCHFIQNFLVAFKTNKRKQKNKCIRKYVYKNKKEKQKMKIRKQSKIIFKLQIICWPGPCKCCLLTTRY